MGSKKRRRRSAQLGISTRFEEEERNDQSPTHKPNLQVNCSPRRKASLVQLWNWREVVRRGSNGKRED